MEIKAADVMKLRKMTGAGMMDCKKALMEAEGDFSRAQDIIREKGKLVVAKRADRSATEGVVVTKIVGQKAYILCLACETDFVAQNAEFSKSAADMLEVAVSNDAADLATLLATKNAEGRTVEELVTEKSGQTGEKIELAYYARIEAPYCHAYVHFNKKLGTVIGFNKVVPEEVAHTVAMQATAMAPIAIDEKDVPADVVEHERKIAIEAMKQDPKNAGKPDSILEKIAEGKMRKFFEENTLLNQALVGEKETIAEYIHKADKEATVIAYKRFALEA
ncbi:MAG TPA: translation elongation factor Ts [Candidatus Alistipes avicola]|uniref:Elongation factor Ts n=1 Tax=Candidatus Alistipes avicola TaxID=2838432 RepID=A0A9D2IBH8_9BACT|nr:translation elongation factor Ts [uncultured Alistipes sp.]HJA98730.1 translation elongation factor Ts [Candidatus Alistipes avicola]